MGGGKVMVTNTETIFSKVQLTRLNCSLNDPANYLKTEKKRSQLASLVFNGIRYVV